MNPHRLDRSPDLNGPSGSPRVLALAAALSGVMACTADSADMFAVGNGGNDSQTEGLDSGADDTGETPFSLLTPENFVHVPGQSGVKLGYPLEDSLESAAPYHPLVWTNDGADPYEIATTGVYMLGDEVRLLGGTTANTDVPYNYADFTRAQWALQKLGFRAVTHGELYAAMSYHSGGLRSLYPWGDGNGDGDPTQIGAAPDGDFLDQCGENDRNKTLEELAHCPDPYTGQLHGLSVQAACGPIATQEGDEEAYEQLAWVRESNLYENPNWTSVQIPDFASAQEGLLQVCGGAAFWRGDGASMPGTTMTAHYHGVPTLQGALYDGTPESCSTVETAEGNKVMNAGSYWDDDASLVIGYDASEPPSEESFEELSRRLAQLDPTDPIGPLAALYKNDPEILAWVPNGCEGVSVGFVAEENDAKSWTSVLPDGLICEFEVGSVYNHGDGQNCPTLVRMKP